MPENEINAAVENFSPLLFGAIFMLTFIAGKLLVRTHMWTRIVWWSQVLFPIASALIVIGNYLLLRFSFVQFYEPNWAYYAVLTLATATMLSSFLLNSQAMVHHMKTYGFQWQCGSLSVLGGIYLKFAHMTMFKDPHITALFFICGILLLVTPWVIKFKHNI